MMSKNYSKVLESYMIPVMEASDDAFITGEYIPEMANKVFTIIKPALPSSGWDFVHYTYDARDHSSKFSLERHEGTNVKGWNTDNIKTTLGRASSKLKILIESYRSKLRDSDKWVKVYIKYEKDGRFKTSFSYED